MNKMSDYWYLVNKQRIIRGLLVLATIALFAGIGVMLAWRG